MAQPIAPRINSHVIRLNRYLPFSAAHDQIYEEYQTGEDSLDLDTVALEYATAALKAGATCIVLTGDAGHGKTHLCRRLLEDYLGHDRQASRQLLIEKCDGSEAIPPAPSAAESRALRIHKDFSEVAPSVAARVLEQSSGRSGEALVVCANEGRLRAIINSDEAGEVSGQISLLFQRSFSTGLASENGALHIINLNYQSVASVAHQRASLLRRTLQSWAVDGRRWTGRGCGTCSEAERCPIRRNRSLLADEADASEMRIRKLEELFATVERLDHVITIREMLMLVAYFITGGLRCEDVHSRAGTIGWQYAYAFYNLLFLGAPDIPEDRLYKGIPLLSVFARLDPGAIASRMVDERLLNLANVFRPGQLDLAFAVRTGSGSRLADGANGIDDLAGTPQNRIEFQKEAEKTGAVVASLRRRAFFDDPESGGSMMARLGFRHGDYFLGILRGDLPAQRQVQLKNLIVAGLHAIQGLRMSRTETMLYLVDPAFGRASADAAIIARRISTSFLQVIPGRRAWNADDAVWTLASSVDWIDRTVVLRIDERGMAASDIALDLLSFECIARSASGYVSEDFYAHQIRRLRTFLGRLAERGRADDGQISLFMNGKVQSVSIDLGVIQVGGGN